MNRVVMVGYMAENPENKTTKSGESMTRFKISVKKKGKIAEGQTKYNYFNCVAFKHTADYVYKYANSQSKIAISGSVENYSYMARDGSKRYGTQINVDDAEIVSSTVNQGDFQQQDSGLEQYQEPQQPGQFTEVDPGDDLPFL